MNAVRASKPAGVFWSAAFLTLQIDAARDLTRDLRGGTRLHVGYIGYGVSVQRRREALMGTDGVQGVGGWLLVYVIGSIPLMLFYSAGLSGWFFDYPLPLMAVIFLAFAIPLLLIPLKSPAAPQWNIALLWVSSTLIVLRMAYGVLFQRILEGRPRLSSEELLDALPILLGIAVFSLGWALVWTKYFQHSVRVGNTFP